MTWLAEREPVFGYRFSEAWLDIGDPAQLLEADNLYRAGSRAACTRGVLARPDSVAPVEEPAQSRHRHVTDSGLP